jgi:hypothetical protein
MNKFFDWLIKSSANPTEVALTAKGLVSAVVPLLLTFIHNPNFSSLPDSAYTLVVAFFTVYSALAVFFGLARKIYLTLFVK